MVLLVGTTLVAHGRAILDAAFFDDHWHLHQYRSQPWTLDSLLEATTIEPARFIHCWWQDETVIWRYARPVATAAAKAVYQVTHSVAALHALSVLLHLANAFLIHQIIWRLTRHRWFAAVGAFVFVVYPHTLFGVYWLAAQNTVLAMTGMLAALLLYFRATRLDLLAKPKTCPSNGTESATDRTSGMAWGWFAVAVCAWLLALGARENAIVLPVVMVAVDLAFGGWRHLLKRWPAYAILAVLGGAYTAWRLTVYYVPMPDLYVRRPDGDFLAYTGWWLAKLAHYLTCTLIGSPLTVGPTGRFNPLSEMPGDTLIMAGVLLLFGIGYVQATRRVRGWWIWPVWLVLIILPVVPLLATPHSGYMLAGPFAIGLVLGPAWRRSVQPRALGRLGAAVAALYVVILPPCFRAYQVLWQATVAAEQITVERILHHPPPPQCTDIFLIDLPFVNVYLQPHLHERMDERGPEARPHNMPECHVLTFADNVLRSETSPRLIQEDPQTFTIARAGRPWFAGALGRFLIEGMRNGQRFTRGEVLKGPLFTAEIQDVSDEGVREIRFRFDRPLVSEAYVFYVTTPQHAAARVRFAGPGEGVVFPLVIGPDRIGPPDAEWGPIDNLDEQRDRLFRWRERLERFIRADLYLTGPPYPGPR